MLSDSKLPQKFWAEALSAAVYLPNRSPAKAVRATTPFEAWTSQKPTVGHLRVFGSDAYPKEEEGIPSLRSSTRKFSWNVVFDETKHAIASKFIELQGVRRIEVQMCQVMMYHLIPGPSQSQK